MNSDKLLNARKRCRARHTGLWAMEASELRGEVASINLGLLHAVGPYSSLSREAQLASMLESSGLEEEERGALGELQSKTKGLAANSIRQRDTASRPFILDPETGIAVIEISGVMGKGQSKFFDVNTIDVRRAVRVAAEDNDVRGIMLLIDSPGGTVAGTAELGDDVRAARERKPVRAHAEDLLASAAFWAAVHAENITASRTTEVGSIGTILVVEDLSKAAEASGIKVHVISTGAMKGAGAEGAEVTEEQLEMFQGRVDAINEHFLSAVREGRRLRGDRLAEVTDGRVFIAEDAQARGLIDGVVSFDESMDSFRRSLDSKSRKRRQRANLAKLNIDLL